MTTVDEQAIVSRSDTEYSAIEHYDEVRALTELLAAPLSAEDQTVQSMPDVSPTKWHRAHVSWFFETFLLRPHLANYHEFDVNFGYLFNSYYEAVGARYPRPARGLVARPGVNEVTAYREHVDVHMRELLSDDISARARELVELGINHEQQHQELVLMDIKHVLSQSPLDPVYVTPPVADDEGSSTSRAAWIAHPGGNAQVGAEGGNFAFDNEAPVHDVRLVPFEICDRLVTCGQWAEFIADGGYRRPELWLSDGWALINQEAWNAPLYWRQESDHEFSIFTLGGRRDLDPNEPVCHVSYYEADAFARWADARLPTEFEWEVVAREFPVFGRFLDPSFPHPRSEAGPSLFGNVWCWTGSAYLPYPGFRPAAGAVGEYNGKFMVNQHVLRGGSCVTPHDHLRPTYRNFFPPASRWPFTGLRLARDR